jgi:phage-related minor tail protein
MEVAAKMAGKTRGEIESIIKESATQKQALAKKESQAKANQERFGEAMEMFKMQALMPLMNLMVKMMPVFMKLLGFISNFVNRALSGATGYVSKFLGVIEKIFSESNSLGDLFKNAIKEIMPLLPGILTDIAKGLGGLIVDAFKFGISLFFNMPWWAQLGLVAAGIGKIA